jgi:two-component system, NarL family, response regulator LiaR
MGEQGVLLVGTTPLEGRQKLMSKEATTRVVLADDHDVVRQGLKRLLDRAPEIEVVGEASDGLEALQFVEDLEPDVLLLDIEMPNMDGIEVARRIHESSTKVRILILSAYDDREYIRALLDIGVSGYLVKGEAPGKIVEAVRGVAHGQKGWVSPQVRKKLEKMQGPAYKQNTLTFRDMEILQMFAEEITNEAIAKKLRMSKTEIHPIIQSLFRKLGVDSRKEAVDVAIKEGWIAKP